MQDDKYLIILTEDSHRSFCYYEAPEKKSGLIISEENLLKAAEVSEANKLPLIFLHGMTELPDGHRNLIKSIPHSSMASYRSPAGASAEVTIIDASDLQQIQKDGYRGSSNLILRLNRSSLAALPQIIELMPPEVKRFNLIITDIDSFTEEDFIDYWKILRAATLAAASVLKDHAGKEFNFLTDRLVLNKMNNCGAGDRHLTLAPNGKLYICPGFYFNDPEDSVGTLDNTAILNSRLYQLENAPLCSVCDAYQCKRCIYLNKKTTAEVNTPGREQCLGSHVERRASEYLSYCLEPGRSSPAIPPIDYLEPFERFTADNSIFNPQKNMNRLKESLSVLPLQDDPRIVYRRAAAGTAGNNDRIEDRERLKEIYKLQKEILVKQDKIMDLLSYIRGI